MEDRTTVLELVVRAMREPLCTIHVGLNQGMLDLSIPAGFVYVGAILLALLLRARTS